ncbi:MAG: hypothetical protein KDD50_14305 [Bdellovibrionales bacterium]|nr:hypothetical protein [Bdellovibrionales bacterium]
MLKACCLILLILLASCTPKKQNSASNIFNVPLADDIKTLDPARAYDSVSLSVVPLVHESLYQYNYLKRPFELEPLLAQNLPQISSDKKTYTIKIKKGVFFHPHPSLKEPRELKAQDFIYAWKRICLPQLSSPGTFIFNDKIIGWDKYRSKIKESSTKENFDQPIEGLTAIDDYTLQIKLLHPYPQLLHALAMGFTAPLPHEVLDKEGQDYLITHMVGTGPFVLKSYINGSKLTLEKNNNYRDEKFPTIPDEFKKFNLDDLAGKSIPFLNQIQFHIYKEAQPQWLNFLSGQIDIAAVPKDNFDQVISGGEFLSKELQDKGIKLYKYKQALMYWLEYNMQDPVVGKNKKLREAISHAIDFDQFNKKFLNDRGELVSSLVTSGIEGYDLDPNKIPKFDLSKAKKLLAEAGFPAGKGLPQIKYDIRGSGSAARQTAEFLKISLEKIGIKLKIIANSFPGYLTKSRKGNLQFSMGGWMADYPDPENFLLLLSKKNFPPGPNSAQYYNPKFEDIFQKIAYMHPSQQRKDLIRQAESLVLADHPRSMSYQLKSYALYYEKVRAYFPTGLINNSYKYVNLKQ